MPITRAVVFCTISVAFRVYILVSFRSTSVGGLVLIGIGAVVYVLWDVEMPRLRPGGRGAESDRAATP